jgi:hypothetical protein
MNPFVSASVGLGGGALAAGCLGGDESTSTDTPTPIPIVLACWG